MWIWGDSVMNRLLLLSVLCRSRLTCWINMEYSPLKLLLVTLAAQSTLHSLRAPLIEVQP